MSGSHSHHPKTITVGRALPHPSPPCAHAYIVPFARLALTRSAGARAAAFDSPPIVDGRKKESERGAQRSCGRRRRDVTGALATGAAGTATHRDAGNLQTTGSCLSRSGSAEEPDTRRGLLRTTGLLCGKGSLRFGRLDGSSSPEKGLFRREGVEAPWRSWDVLSHPHRPREPRADGTRCATMSSHDGGCVYASSANMAAASGSMRRRLEDQEFTLRVYPGALAEGTIYCPVAARKNTTAAEAIECLIERLHLDRTKCYVLAEVKEFGGEEWILNPGDCPVQRMMLWPRSALENRGGLGSGDDYRFLLREKNLDGSIHYGGSLQMWLRVTEERRRLVERGFLPQPAGTDPPSDLCALPELTERALLESLRARFRQEKIYTYVGSILIVINPFQFLPIYNPKYVKLYDNHTLGKLEPHIYAVADVAYHAMLQRRRNQCIVISGESGSGKTQSTNFLIHHLTALSQKGFASGVEQIILGAGPVLEAFGNAKTAHNNNSSRFGKFIQVNYQESGTVRGAYVEKYLLEKSRLVYQEHNERNYHVFYYLLAGASEEERKSFHLLQPEEYHYLNQMTKKSHKLPWDNYYESELQDCFTVEGEDLKHDFERLQLAMEMVGFLPATRKQIFSLLSAILHLGNIRYKKKTYRDDSIDICNPEALPIVSELLEVKEEMLLEALTTRKTVTVGERLIVPYKLAEAGTVRDSMAKSLYSALFDWIVFRTNHALLNNKDLEDKSKILSIGVLDIFGFEDYENNSFEQFCINFANERLQHYFNQHIFKLEQEEYRAEGITWHNIDYSDNSGCINLISKKPTALFHLLDEECNFPQASNQTLLDKFKRQHEGNSYIEFPAVMEPAFIISHYAGKVKYGVKDFREKNTDHMRPDVVALLKSSKNAFICGLMGIDPVATFRWAVLRAYFRAMVAFREAGRRHTHKKTGNDAAVPCAVVKSVDSFSFLHHPVHQRSLEILQRCKDEKYSITRKNPRTPLSDLQGTNALNEKASWDGYGACNGRSSRSGRLSSMGSPALEEDGIFLNSSNSKLLERAQGILLRNRNCKSKPTLPKHLLDVKSLRHLSSVTLHDRITKSLLHLHKKKKPPSISAQFQASLNKLMETLDQSEPYFVKCIRSNAEKLPLRFNDSLVLRQLRYTGMLETVRIRQSGYSIKYTFQDFVRHFHVLLPRGTSPTKSGIREFFRRIHLPPAGYQVGNTMVFLREVERQRLQSLLHQEVLRRIVTLQRRFRAVLQRKHFVNMRLSARVIQRWWRCRLLRQSTIDSGIEEGAVVCLQAAWRSYRERRRFLQWRDSAVIIQRSWRKCRHRRSLAALTLQTAWRGFRDRKRYRQTHWAVKQLQARGRGFLARLRFRDFKEQHERQQLSVSADMEPGTTKDLSSSGQDTAAEPSHDSRAVSSGVGETEREDSNRSRSTDETSHKHRSKRESRRMRELEQAQFSLELLKVRTTSVGGHSVPGSSTSQLGDDHRHSPQGSPTSHGSFEFLSMEDMDTEGSGGFGSQTAAPHEEPQLVDVQLHEGLRDSNHNEKPVKEAPRATFYIASDQSPVHEPRSESPRKSYKERRESTSRRPVVVLISMQKESPVEEGELLAAQILGKASQTGAAASSSQITPIVGLEVGPQMEQPPGISTQKDDRSSKVPPSSIHESSPEVSGICSSEVDIQIVLEPKPAVVPVQQEKKPIRPTQAAPSPVLDTKPPKAQKKSSGQTVIVNMVEKPSSPPVFSPPRRKLPFSKSDKDLVNQERSLSMYRDDSKSGGSKNREVGRPGPKKKARMSRTRSDFLTRCNSEGATQSDDDDEYYVPAHSRTLPPSLTPPRAHPEADCHSDSEMSSHKDTKKIHKTMSSGDLGKVEILRKTPSQDGSRMRGKMRFWSKTKHSEKKLSREKQTSRSEAGDRAEDGSSPSHSPDLEAASSRGVRDSKENKEPSPKMRRRRSVKISSITLEPAQWQSDGLHILSSAHDYRSMNDFLIKKIADLDSEDGKKDTMVDVVFKKALKEFRINIFNSYSTALAMDDGKSIRYKDLYALFEHILEKTMRLEQRDWSESPVKVWVNTFKVFLDEFMTEYKPMEGTIGKAPKRERKKSRKKETDIVEEHNGHIFKSTQYSIPTYCEYCSSLIWMMDRACVCKLCRYACHRKCCSKMTTKCCKKYDPELSSRQFGVELSRLTSEERMVPQLVEKLINYIEMHGLYTEGIYRKSGSTNKIKELRQGLDTDVSSVNLDDYNIHVIASVLKQWLRDLPSPLMTFELYEEFLRAMGQPDKREVIRGVYSVIDQLSRTHLSTLERLIFHLVRIALQEETNRMSANALAIVFAPCVLRCPDSIDPLQSVQDISKTTACVELIINEQMGKYKARLKDISSLEFAETKAKSRLTHIRRSMPNTAKLKGKSRVRPSGSHASSPPLSPKAPPVVDGESAAGAGAGEDAAEGGPNEQQQLAMQQEERILTEQIESLQKEKEELTYEMLILEPRASDDETPESEASIGTADSSENITMELEGATCDPSDHGTGRSRKSDQSRRPLRRQPDSQDSADSASSVSSSCHPSSSFSPNASGSPSPHYRFRSSSSGPLLTSCGLGAPLAEAEGGPRAGKTRHRLRLSRSSPREPSGGHRRDSDFSSGPQPLVLYGSNEFMV
ncbi:unconventional myosin-IXAb-like isoform X5 [Betta splendens]|uniref:Unconventional myosin-IXAb-like isoform X5 n=1 Tax=Betta splendens TaxID=158456 RepID=A0A6P7MNN7_BETSP|nr:unconventional myosin-IXAb-like isoform X5 [Betta splendens]